MTFDNFKISVLILALILITLFSFQRNNNRNIQNNNIVYNESNFKFSSKDSVNKLLKQTNLFSNKILKSKLNLKSIEHAILTNKFIEYADVSIFVDGKVEVNIKEKNPVFRVLGKKYYVDDNGEEMPLSNKFSSYNLPTKYGLCILSVFLLNILKYFFGLESSNSNFKSYL